MDGGTYGYRFILVVVLIGLLLIVVSLWSSRNVRRYSPTLRKDINTVAESIAKRVVVSKQSANVYVALHEADVALGALEALKSIAPGQDLVRLIGVKFDELEKEATQQQWEAMQRLFQQCPTAVPNSSLASVANWYPSSSRYTLPS